MPARSRNAFRTPASSFTFRMTPPTSLLCVTSREFIFTATGYPISRAAATASSSVPACREGTTRIPSRARNAIESAGERDFPADAGEAVRRRRLCRPGKRSRAKRAWQDKALTARSGVGNTAIPFS